MNKKGNLLSILIWSVSTIVVVLFLGAWVFMFNSITDSLLAIPAVGGVDIADAATKTFVPVNSAMSGLRVLSFVLLFSLGFGIIIESYLIRRHPIVWVLHWFITLMAIVSSLYIANEYEKLLESGILSSTLQQFTASSNLILLLPLWTAVLGTIGGIILFVNINRDPELKTTSL